MEIYQLTKLIPENQSLTILLVDLIIIGGSGFSGYCLALAGNKSENMERTKINLTFWPMIAAGILLLISQT